MVSRVFVGNVPFQCTDEEFQDHFKNYEGFKEASIIRRYHSKLSRGFGFVVFDSQDSADKLLAKKDVKLGDRELRFTQYHTKQQPSRYRGYVQNLGFDVTEEQLRLLFNDYADIFVNIKETKRGTRVGIVHFKSYDDYKRAESGKFVLNENELAVEFRERPHREDRRGDRRGDKRGDRRGYREETGDRPRRGGNRRGFSNPRDAYREGYSSGQLVGYQNGFTKGFAEAQRKSTY